ncbi:MAG: 2-oxo acid dehydrogenase subunit E2 [Clostridiales bacterium]|nr:2-oxo acid dehydrogenase subunit E2 [Clostridiales bacterium]
MAQVVIMPRQGISVESCILVEWKKSVGDAVKKGDILFVYETDKAVFEEEATEDGVMLKQLWEEGDDVVCLENVCIIGSEGEDISQFEATTDNKPSKDEAKEETAEVAVKETIETVASEITSTGRMKISPRAKNLAEKSNADLSVAQASGPEGRIIERDIKTLIKNGAKVTSAVGDYAGGAIGTGLAGSVTSNDLGGISPRKANIDVNAYNEVKTTNMRKIIGKAMHGSLSQMAQLTLNSSFDATQIFEFRKNIKTKKEELGLSNITINDMVLFAVSRVLLKHADLNAHFLGDTIRHYETANIGVAVDAERGLMVPTLFEASQMSLNDLSQNAKSIIDQARTGQISPDLLTGGTFTVTNLGTLGVESFTPVINPPQTAILGVCALTTKLKPDGTPYQAMGLSLTFDHKAVDGAPAAVFLKDLCEYLASFSSNLALEAAQGVLV